MGVDRRAYHMHTVTKIIHTSFVNSWNIFFPQASDVERLELPQRGEKFGRRITLRALALRRVLVERSEDSLHLSAGFLGADVKS